jgi:hypothetical protein
MSTKIDVQGVVLTELPGGARLLTVASKAGKLELEFTADAWARLSSTAKWFYSNGHNKESA